MHDWIDLTALWQIVVVGLLVGAGLPAVFALGLRALAFFGRARAGGESGEVVTASPTGLVLGGLCFLVVLAGIGGGIYFIVAGG